MKNLVKLDISKVLVCGCEGCKDRHLRINEKGNKYDLIILSYSCIENNHYTYGSIEIKDLNINKDMHNLEIPVKAVNNYQKYNWYYDAENNKIIVNAKTKNLLNCSNTNISIDNLKNYAKKDLKLAKILYENNIEIINYKFNINLINIDYEKTAKINIDTEIISIIDFIVNNNIEILYFPCDRLACFLLYKWINFTSEKLVDKLTIIFENILII